ncbi:hypothetical protein B1s21160_06030 [Candidatus Nanopelagicus hibericus]|uniref:Uncharacterized protein n=1 Tax=Candidatus Nanopelagicus hibericus TaxID=1884915 RepID=A0A249KAS6_9ACTN|nr:hypothetical protein [Candidatus Nanopelagicus hibericus]ASY13846.1 hypothetical protein B1s21160_06030 [Candidatus Nanopelagicus hibericus]
MIKIVKVILLTISFSIVVPFASADTDPFPGVANGAEIPGTRVSGQQAISCPSGSGSGIEVNATTKQTFTYCVKTWRPSAAIDAEAKYRADLAAAQAAALAQSLAWNTANPGQQKCFQWGPITSPSGGTSSGGVCANPVGTAPSSSGSTGSTPASETRTATTTPTTSGGTTSSTSDTKTATTTPTATVPDPLPSVTNGAEVPGTRVSGAPGQSQVDFEASSAYQSHTCPTGSGRGIGVDLAFTTDRSKHVRYVYCVKTFNPSTVQETVPQNSDTKTATVSTTNTDTKTVITIQTADPIPGASNGAELPGSRITSSAGITQAQWEATNTYKSFVCPTGSGKAVGVDMNFTTTRSDDRWFAYCVKTWIQPANQNPTITDTKTVSATTQSPTTDTRTATSGAAGATSTTPQQSNGVLLIPMSSTVLQTQQILTPVEKESQLVTNKTSKNQSSVSVNTEFANSLLQLTATKKGAKTITLPVQTNSKGDAKLNVKTNLSGYTVSLKAGSETLDSDKVK